MTACARRISNRVVVAAILMFVLTAISSPVVAQTFSQVPALAFTKPFGGANPLPQIVSVASTDGSSIRFTPVASTFSGGGWLSISPSGTGCCFTPEAITATVSADLQLHGGQRSSEGGLPFEVLGGWDDPSISPDVQALIQRSGAAAPLLGSRATTIDESEPKP